MCMSKIIVAGAGHGGIVAAMYLSIEGHDVTVYEKQEKSSVGLDQRDFLDASALDFAGINANHPANLSAIRISCFHVTATHEPPPFRGKHGIQKDPSLESERPSFFEKRMITRSRGLRGPCNSRSSGTRDEEASPRRTAGKWNETAQRCDRLRYDVRG